jgi:hypothetical protein
VKHELKSKRPRLGGKVSPQQWLRMTAQIEHGRQAHTRALEAEAIADWIDHLEAHIEREGKS